MLLLLLEFLLFLGRLGGSIEIFCDGLLNLFHLSSILHDLRKRGVDHGLRLHLRLLVVFLLIETIEVVLECDRLYLLLMLF